MSERLTRSFQGQGLELLLGGSDAEGPALWPLPAGPLHAVAHQHILRAVTSGALDLGAVARGEAPVSLRVLGRPLDDKGTLTVEALQVSVGALPPRELSALALYASEARMALLARAAARDPARPASEDKVRGWVLHRPSAPVAQPRFKPDADVVTRVWRELYASLTAPDGAARQPEEPFDVVLDRGALGALARHLAQAPEGRETLWYGLGAITATAGSAPRFTVTVDRFELASAAEADGCSVRVDAREVARVAAEAERCGRRVLLKGHTHVVDLVGEDTPDGAPPEDNRDQSLVDVAVFRRTYTHPLQVQCIVDGRGALDPDAPERALALYAYDRDGLPRRRRYATEEVRP